MKTKIDTLGDNLDDEQNPWAFVDEIAAPIATAADTHSAANTGLVGADGLSDRERNTLIDINAAMATHDPDDSKGLAALEKEKENVLERMAGYQHQAALNNKKGSVKRAIAPRLKLFKRQNPNAIPIPAPVPTEKKPDKAIIIDCRKQGESFAKQVEATRRASLPVGNSIASMEREIDGDAWLPDFSKWTSRTRDPDDWNSASLTPENLYGIICELLGDELKAKYREKFERHRKARGDGLTNQQIAKQIESINKEWLAVQRLEHSHMKGFAAQGLDLTWNSKLSIMVALEFRVEGITALHGQHGHFEEGW